MTSLIDELQHLALRNDTSAVELLRKALFVATKLKLTEPSDWIRNELNGYEDSKLPDYRILHGVVRFQHPYYGWRPFMISDPKVEEIICTKNVAVPIGEIEHLLTGKGQIYFTYSASQLEILWKGIDFPISPTGLFVQRSAIAQLVQAVRGEVLQWALNLEAAGVKGEGLSFSPQEQQMAKTPATITIGSVGTFSGAIGTSGGVVQTTATQTATVEITGVTSLVGNVRQHASSMGLSPEKEAELRSLADQLEAEASAPAPEPGKLRRLLDSVQSIAAGAAENVVAAGIGAMAAKLLGF